MKLTAELICYCFTFKLTQCCSPQEGQPHRVQIRFCW